MNQANFSRRWRTILWLLIGCGLLLTLLAAWDQTRWRYLGREEGAHRWKRGHEIHFDTNGDGAVDEVVIRVGGPRFTRHRRDTNGDGWLDLEYDIRDGLAHGVRNIRLRAPRHPLPAAK